MNEQFWFHFIIQLLKAPPLVFITLLRATSYAPTCKTPYWWLQSLCQHNIHHRSENTLRSNLTHGLRLLRLMLANELTIGDSDTNWNSGKILREVTIEVEEFQNLWPQWHRTISVWAFSAAVLSIQPTRHRLQTYLSKGANSGGSWQKLLPKTASISGNS